ncbi:FbpB family small basic protein [Halalkalibacillus halophilus]|nr:FbpB family small basic protein [Halalkalibacillus halophilus]
MRRREQLSFQKLFTEEKEKILSNPEELEQIHQKVEERLSVIKDQTKHA